MANLLNFNAEEAPSFSHYEKNITALKSINCCFFENTNSCLEISDVDMCHNYDQ